MPDPPLPTEPLVSEAREVLHTVNNFLTLCLTHSEAALDSDERESMRHALRQIVEGSQEMAGFVRQARSRLVRLTPRTAPEGVVGIPELSED